jgi:hypothetical protein
MGGEPEDDGGGARPKGSQRRRPDVAGPFRPSRRDRITCHSPPTMLRKQVSGPDPPSWPLRPSRSNELEEDLVTGRSEVFVPFRFAMPAG